MESKEEPESNVILFPRVIHPVNQEMVGHLIEGFKIEYLMQVANFTMDRTMGILCSDSDFDDDDDVTEEMITLLNETILALLFRANGIEHPLHYVRFTDADEDESEDETNDSH